MKTFYLPLKLSVLLICLLTTLIHAQGQSWLDQYNISWDSQSSNAAGSMPCGGHDIGLNVWVENDQVLLYMQRSGSIAENNEYLKLGRVRINMTPNPFANGTFKQELKLHEGQVAIHGSTTYQNQPLTATINIWVETARPVIHIEVDSNRKISVNAAYENWRFEDEDLPNTLRRRSIFDLEGYPSTITLSKDNVQFNGSNVIFYHRNPNNDLVPRALIKQQGLQAYADEISDDILGRTFGGIMTAKGFITAGESSGKYGVKPFKALHIKSQSPSLSHKIRIVTHIDQTDTLEQWRAELNALVNQSSNDLDNARKNTIAWWDKFWNRSWISIQPGNPDPTSKPWRMARNYNLFRYQLGCNAFGEYPTRFNGGNFTVDADMIGSKGKGFGPDWRDWGGGVFTAQNQRLIYWPMLKAGDFDAIHSQFKLYQKATGGARARVKAHFGHDGALYSEYIGVPGIAFGCGWGWPAGSPGRIRGTEIPFGDPRATGNKGYVDLVEKGVMANQSCAYHWESQLENAYMILEYHRFTNADIKQYMLFIENAVIFFDEHYRLREKKRTGKELDAKGKLVIYPSTSCETYRGAKNPTDVIAGLQACLEAILKLDGSLLNLRDKAYYQAFLDTIPDISFGEINGHPVIRPAASWESVQNIECPHFYPLFPFNRFDLQGKDSRLMQTFRNTWKYDKTFPKNMVISWHQDGIFYARMAMTDAAANYNLKKLENSPRRFPTFWGPGHDWVPDHNWGGSGMIGLQEMVMQTIGKKIYLLPAWPKDWDVDFKLHAPNKTVVEVSARAGKITKLKVTPASRRKDIILATKYTSEK